MIALNRLKEFKNTIETDGIVFCYSGPMTQGVIEDMSEVIRQRIESNEDSNKVGDIVFSIFIEQVQNVMKYSAETRTNANQNTVKLGITLIGSENGKYWCIAGNMVTNDQTEELVKNLGKIKSLDKTELKALYKEQIKKTVVENHGAGLGFIDMARKSSSPLDYYIEKVDENISFFSLKVSI